MVSILDLAGAGKMSTHIYIYIMNTYSHVYIYLMYVWHQLFSYSSISGHLDCFQLFAVIYDTATKSLCTPYFLVQIPVSGITWPEGRNIFKLLISIVKSPLERLYQVTHQAAVRESDCFIPLIVIDILDIYIDMFLPIWSKSGRVTPFFLFFPLWFS